MMNQSPGNLNDQIGQLTYRPERTAIYRLDELGAAHMLSASQSRVLGFIGDDGAVELATIVEGLAGKARMRLRPGLGSSSEPHALARSAAVLDALQGERWRARHAVRDPAGLPRRARVWGASASKLRVHRQTLTARIRRIEEFGRPSAGRPARSRRSAVVRPALSAC